MSIKNLVSPQNKSYLDINVDELNANDITVSAVTISNWIIGTCSGTVFSNIVNMTFSGVNYVPPQFERMVLQGIRTYKVSYKIFSRVPASGAVSFSMTLNDMLNTFQIHTMCYINATISSASSPYIKTFIPNPIPATKRVDFSLPSADFPAVGNIDYLVEIFISKIETF